MIPALNLNRLRRPVDDEPPRNSNDVDDGDDRSGSSRAPLSGTVAGLARTLPPSQQSHQEQQRAAAAASSSSLLSGAAASPHAHHHGGNGSFTTLDTNRSCGTYTPSLVFTPGGGLGVGSGRGGIPSASGRYACESSGDDADENDEEDDEGHRHHHHRRGSAADVAHLMGFDAEGCDDVEELRNRLRAAQRLFVALERRYDEELLRKERRVVEQLERLVGGGPNVWNPFISPLSVQRSPAGRSGVANKAVQVGAAPSTTPIGSARSLHGGADRPAGVVIATPRSGRAGGGAGGGGGETNSSRLRRQLVAGRTEQQQLPLSGTATPTTGAGSPSSSITAFALPIRNNNSGGGSSSGGGGGGGGVRTAAFTARSPAATTRVVEQHIAMSARGVGRVLQYAPHPFGQQRTGGDRATPTPTTLREAATTSASASGATPRGAQTPRPYAPAHRRLPSHNTGPATPRR